MTNMMMNGAVAINGGVGVMEIRRPLPQTVESMAQAVEDLAVNEQKTTLPKAGRHEGLKIPFWRQSAGSSPAGGMRKLRIVR